MHEVHGVVDHPTCSSCCTVPRLPPNAAACNGVAPRLFLRLAREPSLLPCRSAFTLASLPAWPGAQASSKHGHQSQWQQGMQVHTPHYLLMYLNMHVRPCHSGWFTCFTPAIQAALLVNQCMPIWTNRAQLSDWSSADILVCERHM